MTDKPLFKQMIDITMQFQTVIDAELKHMIEVQNEAFINRGHYENNVRIVYFDTAGQYQVQDIRNFPMKMGVEWHLMKRGLVAQLRNMRINPVWMCVTINMDLRKNFLEGSSQPGVMFFTQTQLLSKRKLYTPNEIKRLVPNPTINKQLKLDKDLDDMGILLPYNIHYS